MLETLPAELLAIVAGYLDLPNHIRIASCNKTLEDLIYRQCESLWTVIRLERLSSKVAFHLKDGDLHVLLSKCNAREVTRILSLRGCASLRGYALDAVRGSRALKRLDLRTDCSNGRTGYNRHAVHDLRDGGCCSPEGPEFRSGIFFDHQYVFKFLSSTATLHYGLAKVDLDPCDFEGTRGKDAAKRWMENYEETCQYYTSVLRLACTKCSKKLADVDPGEGCNSENVFESQYWKYSYYGRHQCSKCNVQSCCQGACPKISKCFICFDACCDSCIDPRGFDDEVCKQCAAERACVHCGDFDPGEYTCGCLGRTNESCASCDIRSCEECSFYCDNCANTFCSACQRGKKCPFCNDGKGGKFCSECSKQSKWAKCENCNRRYCCNEEHSYEEFGIKKCKGCEMLICEECMEWCWECQYCENCAGFGSPCNEDCPGGDDCFCKCDCVKERRLRDGMTG